MWSVLPRILLPFLLILVPVPARAADEAPDVQPIPAMPMFAQAPAAGDPGPTASAAGGKGLQYPAGRWVFQTSAYTKHFKPDSRHTNQQKALDFEYWAPDRWVYGATFLRNSFDQPTQYLYAGRIWRPFVSDSNVFLKLTGGVLHGYKGEFRDKIPFNRLGYAPGLIPSIGYSWRQVVGEVLLLGGAAVMVSVGVFWE